MTLRLVTTTTKENLSESALRHRARRRGFKIYKRGGRYQIHERPVVHEGSTDEIWEKLQRLPRYAYFW